jgi:hypothetical protein
MSCKTDKKKKVAECYLWKHWTHVRPCYAPSTPNLRAGPKQTNVIFHCMNWIELYLGQQNLRIEGKKRQLLSWYVPVRTVCYPRGKEHSQNITMHLVSWLQKFSLHFN